MHRKLSSGQPQVQSVMTRQNDDIAVSVDAYRTLNIAKPVV